MFSSDEEKETPEGDSSCAATVGTNPTPGTEKDFDFNGLTTDEDGHKVRKKQFFFQVFSFTSPLWCDEVLGDVETVSSFLLSFFLFVSFFCRQNFKVSLAIFSLLLVEWTTLP